MNETANAALARDLISRMRGPGGMIVLTVYLGLLGLVVGLTYRSVLHDTEYGGDSSLPVTEWTKFSQNFFEWTLLAMLILVLFLVPGFTAGSIVDERERLTLKPVQVTLLRSANIVLGKIGASAAFTLLLVLAALPLLAVTYLIGGVAFPDILKGLGMVMFTALEVAAIALMCSALMRSTTTATLMCYGAVLLLTIGTSLSAVFVVSVTQPLPSDFESEPPGIAEFILVANPVAAFADAVGDTSSYVTFRSRHIEDGPLTSVKESLEELRPERGGLPFWAWHVLIMSTVAALSFTVSCRRLRTPADR